MGWGRMKEKAPHSNPLKEEETALTEDLCEPGAAGNDGDVASKENDEKQGKGPNSSKSESLKDKEDSIKSYSV